MPRFFFNEFNGGYTSDREGVECNDIQDMRLEAIVYAASFLRENPEHAWMKGRMGVQVTDHTGATVMKITIYVDDSPAETTSLFADP